MNYTNCTIIILAADKTKAQAVSGDTYFNAEASEDGLAPATHYFTSGIFDNSAVDAIVNDGFSKWIRSENWQGALAGLGLVQVVPVIPEADPSVVLTVPPANP
jgi:hypothetical protein